MDCNQQIAGNRIDIGLSGRFTFADHKEFRAIIEKIEGASVGQVRFDLSNLSYLDSAALGMLLLARDKCIAKGKQVSLRGGKDQVQRVMAAAHFDRLFTIEP